MKKTLFFIFFFLSAQHIFSQSQSVDSLLKEIAIEKEEDKKVDLIIRIWTTGFDRDPNLIIQTGKALLVQGQENKNRITEASAYCFLGTGYRISGNPIRALEVQQKGLVLAEKAGNFSILAMIRNQIAHTYRDREEWENAFKIYYGASVDAAKGENEIIKIWPLMNMGVCYLNLNKLDSALSFLQRSYESSIRNNKVDVAYILWNLGSVNSKMGNAALAVTYFNMAIQEAGNDKKIRQLSFAYTGLAEHFQRMSQRDSIIFYAKKGLDVVQHTPFFFMSVKPAKMLAELYEKSNCDSTLKYANIYKIANDSVASNKINQQIQVMTFDETLRQQELAAEKMKTNDERKQNIQFALIAFGIISFIIIFLLLSRSFITNTKLIEFLGVIALLIVFEFLNLLLHPFLERVTNHSPVLMLLALVCIAALLVPLHHKVEKWATAKLVEKNKKIRLAAAKKTIEQLEGDADTDVKG
ncbi:MAG: tetratricopeptide repeat protein [Ferruginibacter sp.]